MPSSPRTGDGGKSLGKGLGDEALAADVEVELDVVEGGLVDLLGAREVGAHEVAGAGGGGGGGRKGAWEGGHGREEVANGEWRMAGRFT